MKKLFLITISLLLLCTGIAAAQDRDPLYDYLIRELTAVLDGQASGNLIANEDYSVLLTWLTGQPGSRNIGYALTDVDGNGVQELLVGENPGEQPTVLYDMYTIRDGQIVHVFDGWERNRFYLCTNGNFLNEGSSGAMQSSTTYYIYAKGDLIFIRSVIYDTTFGDQGPWFVSYDVPYVAADPTAPLTEITEAQAAEMNKQFQTVRLELTPFLNK